MGIDQPGIAPSGGPPYGPVTVGGNPYRRMRPLHRAGRQLYLGNVIISSVEFHLLFSPEEFYQLQGFPHPPYPLAGLYSEGGELLFAVTKTDAEYEPASADRVQSCHAIGYLNRVVQRQQNNRGSNLHVAGFGCQPCQQRHGGAHLIWSCQVVLGGADKIEPGLPGRLHLLHALLDLVRHRLAGHVLAVYE